MGTTFFGVVGRVKTLFAYCGRCVVIQTQGLDNFFLVFPGQVRVPTSGTPSRPLWALAGKGFQLFFRLAC